MIFCALEEQPDWETSVRDVLGKRKHLEMYSNEHKTPKSKLLEIWTLLVFLSLEFFPFFFPINQDLVMYALHCLGETTLFRKIHLIMVSYWKVSLTSPIP